MRVRLTDARSQELFAAAWALGVRPPVCYNGDKTQSPPRSVNCRGHDTEGGTSMRDKRTYSRVIIDPELGRVEQFVRIEEGEPLIGWERYDHGETQSPERVLGYESEAQLLARGYEVVA